MCFLFLNPYRLSDGAWWLLCIFHLHFSPLPNPISRDLCNNTEGECPVNLLYQSLPQATGFPCGKESACHTGDAGSIPGLGRCPGEGNGNPLQNSCLGNPMDRGAWQVAVESTGLEKRHDWVHTHPKPHSCWKGEIPSDLVFCLLGLFFFFQFQLC